MYIRQVFRHRCELNPKISKALHNLQENQLICFMMHPSSYGLAQSSTIQNSAPWDAKNWELNHKTDLAKQGKSLQQFA